MARLSASEIRAAAETLRRLLERVASGELTAPGGLVARLEGATTALEALTRRRQRTGERAH